MNIIERDTLQRSSPPLVPHPDQGFGAPPSTGGISFEFLFDFARRRAWTILISASVMAILGLAYFFLVPAPYTAVATLSIDTRRFQLFHNSESLGERLINSNAAMESELEVIKSEKIALSVIKKLGLAEDPEFGKGSAIPFLVRFPVITRLLAPRSDTEIARTRNAVSVLGAFLTVKRMGAAYTIEISFQSIDSERAAQVANAVAEAYIADQLDSKYEATRRGSHWLEGRIKELSDQVAIAEKAIIEYKAKNNLVEAGQGRLSTDQQLSELNNQLSVARSKTLELRMRIDLISRILREKATDATIVNVSGDIINNNPLITRLRTQYLDAASREREWSEKFGPAHLAAVNLRNNMRAIRGAIRGEMQRIEEALKNDYEVASRTQTSLESQLQQAILQSQGSDEAQVKLRQLVTNAMTYKKLYDSFMQRYAEAVEQQAFNYTEARLLTEATPPARRAYRKTLLIVAFMPFLGLSLGIGLAAAREFLDRGFRTSSQVESNLSLACLALIPAQDSKGKQSDESKKWWLRPMAAITLPPKSNQGNFERTIEVMDGPLSQFSEAIRCVKLTIDLQGEVDASKIIGLTSSVPEEGKTTISAALARGIAQAGASVILVDCDFRNPSMTRMIAPQAKLGIFHVLANKATLEEATLRSPSASLSFLPAVSNTRVANSSEILSSGALKKLFKKLSESYDYVLVDLPPLAPLVDVRATAHLIDHYVFVIEWGKTSTDVVQHALSRAPHVHQKIIGAVLNKVDMAHLALYDGNRAKFYHNEAYGRYGYTS